MRPCFIPGMPNTGFARQTGHWRAAVAAAGLALMALAGPAGAAGTDKLVPVRPAADAPGMIRFDTCSRPAWPEGAREQSQEGMVTMRFLVGAEGTVKDARVVKSSGYPALDEAAMTAIAKCRFNPPVAEGRPVNAWIHFQYVWKPE